MYEIHEASSLIQEEAHEDAEVIWGWVIDDTMEDEARVTVIATGFEESRQVFQTPRRSSVGSTSAWCATAGASRPRPRELHSGIDPIYEDYDIPTLLRHAD